MGRDMHWDRSQFVLAEKPNSAVPSQIILQPHMVRWLERGLIKHIDPGEYDPPALSFFVNQARASSSH